MDRGAAGMHCSLFGMKSTAVATHAPCSFLKSLYQAIAAVQGVPP